MQSLASGRKKAAPVAWTRAAWSRYRVVLALAGALVAAGQILWWSSLGAWPFHDTAAFWLAGVHLREGAAPYAGDPNFLTMLYAPPWVVLMAGVSFVPLVVVEVALFAAEVGALRFIAGSWVNVGLLGWLPFVPRELVTGNIDLLMAAAVLVAVRGGRTSPIALFALAKFSPALALLAPGARRREAIVAGVVLVAITLPWLSLWPQWADELRRAQGSVGVLIPILPRIPVVLGLLALRRPWAIAAAAALATPGFYFHSVVLLLPAAFLLLEGRATRPAP